MRPTIILGMSRSGSKLLKNTLNAQKDVYCTGEIVWNHTFLKSNLIRYASGHRELCKDTAKVEYDSIPIEDIISFKKSSILDLSKLMQKIKEYRQVSHVVAKYPISLHNWVRTNSSDKNLFNVVLLIRDPVSVLRSDTVYKKTRWPHMPGMQISLSLYHCYQYYLALKFKKQGNVAVFDYAKAMSSLTLFKSEMKHAFDFIDVSSIVYPQYKNSSRSFNKNEYSNFKPQLLTKVVLFLSKRLYNNIIDRGGQG